MDNSKIFKAGTFMQHIPSGKIGFIWRCRAKHIDFLWLVGSMNTWGVDEMYNFRKTELKFSIDEALFNRLLNHNNKLDNLDYIELIVDFKKRKLLK